MQRPEPMASVLTVLALESTCDDTAAAVVRDVALPENRILSSVVLGQTDLHAEFGGVVPEIAARAHAERIDHAVERALAEADLGLGAMDAVAVAAGPGLIGGVLAGVMCARGIAAGLGIPVLGVNHLAGHALTPRLTDDLDYPYLMLLVSGGHCQFLLAEGPGRFHRLGGTIDDAPGEAFDKVARLLGLGQPGGPAVEEAARDGTGDRFALPRPLLDRPGCDMSFSGLKTAVVRTRDAIVAEHGGLPREERADLAAGFQAAVSDILSGKLRRGISLAREMHPGLSGCAVAGGVAANRTIRTALKSVCADMELAFLAPPMPLCTDNAAMIGWAGIEMHRDGLCDAADLVARPRWPLDDRQAALLGGGKKGPKA